jgi:hypothetical protein
MSEGGIRGALLKREEGMRPLPPTPIARMYTTPMDDEDRKRLALGALRVILDIRMLPFTSLEVSALSHILESVARRVG